MEDLIKYRRELHTHPELSGEEYHTQKRVRHWVGQYRPDSIVEVGGTGLLVTFKGIEEGVQTLLRAEIDALPIQEENEMPHVSSFTGIGHKCGHDGHAIILVGVAKYLSMNRPTKGAVHLLFQPAEETGEGARAVLQDENFIKIEPDYVFALHNIPGEPLHQIILKNGPFTPAVKSIIFYLKGKTSHAAEPENGINPAMAIADIIQKAHKLQVPEEDNDDFAVITPIQIEMGEEAYGISAGEGTVRFTVRSWTSKRLKEIDAEMVKMATDVAKSYQLILDISFTQFFEANENGNESVKLLEEAADEAGLKKVHKERPFKWGEDFGDFTQRYKGAMFGLGAGEDTPALHHPLYDFPDELLNSGVKIFTSLIKKLHS